MTMIGSLLRFGRRQLHTIVSREVIKPSSPTPSQLETYSLSLFDQISLKAFIPIVMFYPKSPGTYCSSLILKKSLSPTLTKYYPFAGRHAKTAPAYVECNDDGAEFLEASKDTTLYDFLQNMQHEDLDHLFPYSLVWYKSNRIDQSDKVIPLAVQVNHFECGGVAVAASLSHKIADASSMAHFLNDWAKMTRFCSKKQKDEFLIDPDFISFPHSNMNCDGVSLERSNDCVTRSFIFPNSKINDLKLKVKAMTEEAGQPITNLTRVEVLNWLLYKSAVAAATKNNSGSFKPTGVHHLSNLRGKMIEPLPEKSIGNFAIIMEIQTNNESEIKPDSFINELKNKKMQYQGIKNIETAFGLFSKTLSSKTALEEQQSKIDGAYMLSSLCGYPLYDIDFGWGKPVKATLAGSLGKNSFVLMDLPNKDGIEALVCLGNRDMDIFQSDPELLAFC